MFKKSLKILYIFIWVNKIEMYNYDVYKVLYLKCDMYGLWVSCLGYRIG